MAEDQILLEFRIPEGWKPHYLLKRIDEEDILITQQQRNNILKALAEGIRFVQINEYTIMLNAIKGINPRYEPNNIPGKYQVLLPDNTHRESTHVEQDLWDKIFKPEVLKHPESPVYKLIKDNTIDY